ncbi:hypothetical protein HMPREF2909_08545 [Alloscardovia sp. HMSC034E08]|nr:hypothetical protein HMPREF2909_08545 [Alloscardovia sp. HMSC034E08]
MGSLGCRLSQDAHSFALLLIFRVIQSLGCGGIMPIATAAVGSSVPENKRGLALGLVGVAYGVDNVLGASAGSAILAVAGVHNEQWIFYISVPSALAIVAFGWVLLRNETEPNKQPIDYPGIAVLVTAIIALLWSIQHFDPFDALATAKQMDVCLPLFVFIENKAADPVITLRYFTTRAVLLTLLLGTLSGVIIMVLVFVPQFAENSMRLPTGSGGYPVIILGLASGVGAPLSRRFTDKFGARFVLCIGAIISVIAALSLNFWAVPQPGYVSALVSLILMGLGLGFLVGAPLNYLIMQHVPQEQITSGLANLSLMRSIGTMLAPAIFVGLLANSLVGLPQTLTAELPTKVDAPALPHAAELQEQLEVIRKNPYLDATMKKQLNAIPDLTNTSITIL